MTTVRDLIRDFGMQLLEDMASNQGELTTDEIMEENLDIVVEQIKERIIG